MEAEVLGSPKSDDKIDATEEIAEDEDKREMAIPDEASKED